MAVLVPLSSPRILAVEELSRVDASVGVLVDVQNTLVNNAFYSLGNSGTEAEVLDSVLRAKALAHTR